MKCFTRYLAVAVLALCGFAACSKKEPSAPAAPEETQAAAAPVVAPGHTAAAAPKPEPTAEEIPMPEDFRAQAVAEVTASTLKTELDSIEKELNAPAP